MDTFLLIATWACTILLGLSAFFDNWASLSQRPIFHGRPWINTTFLGKANFKFSWFIVFTALSLGLTYYTAQRSDEKAKTEIAQRDRAHQKHDDSLQLEYKKDIRATNDSNIKSFSKSLEEYNLTYNEQEKKVQSLIRNSISREIPSLDISTLSTTGSIDKTNDSLKYLFTLTNLGNCPVLANVQIYVVLSKFPFFQCPEYPTGLKNYTISQGTAFHHQISINYNLLPEYIYFLILGSYSNTRKTITNKVDVLLQWDIQNNFVGVPSQISFKDSIENKIKTNCKIKS